MTGHIFLSQQKIYFVMKFIRIPLADHWRLSCLVSILRVRRSGDNPLVGYTETFEKLLKLFFDQQNFIGSNVKITEIRDLRSNRMAEKQWAIDHKASVVSLNSFLKLLRRFLGFLCEIFKPEPSTNLKCNK